MNEVTSLIKYAESKGWEVEFTRKKHLRFRSPNGKSVFCPSSPSDWRSLKNVKTKLRHQGLEF